MITRPYPFIAIFIVALVLFTGCKKEGNQFNNDRQTYIKAIDPKTDVSLLCRLLQVSGDNISGNIPASSGGSAAPKILISQASASVTEDNTLFVPFSFSSTQEVKDVYLQLKGADNFWRVALTETANHVYVASLGIPRRVLAGPLVLLFAISDISNKVSELRSMMVEVVPNRSGCQAGNSARVEGNDGLTVSSFDMGDYPGKVTISYDTYTVKDRIDIRYNGQWVASTGALLKEGGTPPIKQCNLVGNNDGFVGKTGTFQINYDPAISKRIDVYVSGCLDGGTQWYFNIYCPLSDGSTARKQWYDDLPDCPCTYAEAQELMGDGAGESGGKWTEVSWWGKLFTIEDFHFGASHDVRWVPPASSGSHSGQQCTYFKDILVTSGIGAGSPDRVSPGYSLPAHWVKDMEPWWTLPCKEYIEKWKANTGNCVASNPVSDISHIVLLYDRLTCEDFTILIQGAVADDQNKAIPKTLQDYLLGKKKGAYSRASLLAEFNVWKTNVSMFSGIYGFKANLGPTIDKTVAILQQ